METRTILLRMRLLFWLRFPGLRSSTGIRWNIFRLSFSETEYLSKEKSLRVGSNIRKGLEQMASIKERNGKYVVIYSYKDENDNRKQKWETYKTKSEAKKRKQEIEYKQEMGSFIVPQCHTVKDLLDEYIAIYGKDKWAISTYEGNAG